MADDENLTPPPGGAPEWVTMDGIVEGRIGDFTILTAAVRELNALGVSHFELDRDGGKFSLMPDDAQVPGRGFDEEGQSRLLQHLSTLAKGASGPVESTLRCTMVFAEQCAETLFHAAAPPPAGPGIEALTRVRPRQPTDAPPASPPALPWRKLLMRREVLIAVPLLLLVFSFMAWQSGLIDRLLSASAAGMTVDTDGFGDLLTAEVDNEWGNYLVTIRRGPGHPDTAAAWDELAAAATTESERLHRLVVREGQDVYVQLRDGRDEVLAEAKADLRALVTAADGEVEVRLPGRMAASKVVLSVTKHERK